MIDYQLLEKRLDATWVAFIKALLDGDDAAAKEVHARVRALWEQYTPEDREKIRARLDAQTVRRQESTLT